MAIETYIISRTAREAFALGRGNWSHVGSILSAEKLLDKVALEEAVIADWCGWAVKSEEEFQRDLAELARTSGYAKSVVSSMKTGWAKHPSGVRVLQGTDGFDYDTERSFAANLTTAIWTWICRGHTDLELVSDSGDLPWNAFGTGPIWYLAGSRYSKGYGGRIWLGPEDLAGA